MSNSVPLEIGDDERLGNRLNDKRRRRLVAKDWVPREHEKGKSVDRLDHCDLQTLTRIAVEENARQNELEGRTSRHFRGWGCVRARDVRALKITPVASPTNGNPYHADLLYPALGSSSEEAREDRAELAQELGRLATFIEPAEL